MRLTHACPLVAVLALGCSNPTAGQIRQIASAKLGCPESEVEIAHDPDEPNDSSWIAGCDFRMVRVDCEANQTCHARLTPAKRLGPELGIEE